MRPRWIKTPSGRLQCRGDLPRLGLRWRAHGAHQVPRKGRAGLNGTCRWLVHAGHPAMSLCLLLCWKGKDAIHIHCLEEAPRGRELPQATQQLSSPALPLPQCHPALGQEALRYSRHQAHPPPLLPGVLSPQVQSSSIKGCLFKVKNSLPAGFSEPLDSLSCI